ncbi:TetR family transcriptional regulator [Knoellia remsis]|uniref:TetR family transcriptional regulator n=1 Tax=Knoellia remsis TaxID=407159 RepID=A0A2T0UGY1_9MICO|nr:TetR/AcrR family transcriptional regulator [Knoellia remsis]PRY57116.1 TetR family transcriptional regulator [Knoellia remsis]
MSETAPPAEAPSDGLRARNRERTTKLLEQAAWDLVAEQGFESVTADAVADRAGVSRRTFYNYFPRVELVLQERMRETIAGLVDRFLERPADESLQESLLAVLTEPFDAAVLEKAVVVFGQSNTSPAARQFVMEAQSCEAEQVIRALEDRLGPDADPLAAQVVAQTVLTVGHVATMAWVEQSGGVVDDRTRQLHLDLLRQAFMHLATAFIAPGDTDPGSVAQDVTPSHADTTRES